MTWLTGSNRTGAYSEHIDNANGGNEMENIKNVFTNEDTRMQTKVSVNARFGFAVSLWDLDSGESANSIQLFEKYEDAVAKAKEVLG